MSESFGITTHVGLTEALLQQGPISSFAQRVAGNDNLWVLPSGTLTADSPNLLNSERLSERLVELRQEFEYVIIDTPPLIRYSDAVAVGQLSDGLIMIVEANSTRREAATVVADNLRSMKIPILAAVLNKRTFPIPEKIYRRI